MKKIIQSLRVYVILTLLLGCVYPLLITVIAQRTMPDKANGSLLAKNNSIIGSALIGQNFNRPEYFQGRPSANTYDGTNSGGTNLGPSSAKLMESVAGRIARVRQENELTPDMPIPADMVLSSASGLDPHISPADALLQAPRISRIRGIAVADLKKMISDSTDPDFLGLWGRPGVNVLKLNRALDSAGKGR